MKKIKLSNGVEMPQLGYGVYQVEPDECERCVLDALSVGYRMIDTMKSIDESLRKLQTDYIDLMLLH